MYGRPHFSAPYTRGSHLYQGVGPPAPGQPWGSQLLASSLVSRGGYYLPVNPYTLPTVPGTGGAPSGTTATTTASTSQSAPSGTTATAPASATGTFGSTPFGASQSASQPTSPPPDRAASVILASPPGGVGAFWQATTSATSGGTGDKTDSSGDKAAGSEATGSGDQDTSGGDKAASDTGAGGDHESSKGHKSDTAEERAAEVKEAAGKADPKWFDTIGKATTADKDNLQEIKGVGPFIEEKLNGIGIFTFEQISKFTPEIEEQVNEAIEFFKGRIHRDDWKGQAAELNAAKSSA